MKILILVANPIEVAPFDLAYTDPVRGDLVEVKYTGIGKLNAFEKTLEAISFRNYDVVLNVGTCGSSVNPIGTILLPDRVVQGDAFVEDGFDKYEYHFCGCHKPTCSLLTADVFTVGVEREGFIELPENKREFDLFDMEAYAIARAADIKGYLPKTRFIKIVSDNLDSSVYDWEDRAKELAGILCPFVENYIASEYIPGYHVTVA